MNKLVSIAAILLIALFALSSPAVFALDKTIVPAGETGVGIDTIVVAEKGSVVVVRKGANVQYWPGSNLVHISQATDLPDCSGAKLKVDSNKKELWVSDGASACALGDTAVVALEGSTIIYDVDVPLIRRAVNRR